VRTDVAVVLGVLVLSSAVAAVALATASGVVLVDAGTYDTEFISGWWWLTFLLVPLPAVYPRRRTTAALVAAVAPWFPTSLPLQCAWRAIEPLNGPAATRCSPSCTR
jgi:hypothetical protein